MVAAVDVLLDAGAEIEWTDQDGSKCAFFPPILREHADGERRGPVPI